MAASASGGVTGKPEGRLYDAVLRLDKYREKRLAAFIHISRLRPENRREHNLRIATHTFDNIIGQFEGEVFVLSNSDIVFIAHGVPRLQIERSIERLRALFSEDPLIYSTGMSGKFCTWYDLAQDYDNLAALSKSLMLQTAAIEEGTTQSADLIPLTSRTVANLEDALNKADITNYVRNQTVCIYAHGAIQPVFDELYVSIGDLQKTLLPAYDFRGSRWLFQHLTETLDRRMFAYLGGLEYRPDRVFSINLNISSVLSPEFAAYDRALTASARGGNLVIEIQKHDIFADMGAYVFAQEYLHERTHKLCLDGITHLTLPFIDRERLKLDLIKLCWSPELIEKRDRLLPQLKDDIARIGGQRFIMIHCDTPDALEIGGELGISMFQGRYVSHVLQRSRTSQPAKAATA